MGRIETPDVQSSTCAWTADLVAPFEIEPGLGWEALRAEGVSDIRWWTLDEIATSGVVFAPRRLATVLSELLEHGPPDTPLDVGV